MLLMHSQLLPTSNSTFLTLGEKLSKMSIYFFISKNCDLSLKLNSTHQQESRGILGFQNRVSNIKLLKIHTNRDNSAYLEKYDFQRKLVCQF